MDHSKIVDQLIKIAYGAGFQIIFYECTEATCGPYVIPVKNATGICTPTQRVIYIYQNPKVPVDWVKMICVIAHEVGHALDWNRIVQIPGITVYHLTAYWKTGNLAPELAAWILAGQMLKELGFTEWDEYDRHRREALKTYGYEGP